MSANPFECPVCLEFYDNKDHIPTTFPCGHTCCMSHVPGLDGCPICRGPIPKVVSPNVALRDGAVAFSKIMKEEIKKQVITPTPAPAPTAIPAPATVPAPPPVAAIRSKEEAALPVPELMKESFESLLPLLEADYGVKLQLWHYPGRNSDLIIKGEDEDVVAVAKHSIKELIDQELKVIKAAEAFKNDPFAAFSSSTPLIPTKSTNHPSPPFSTQTLNTNSSNAPNQWYQCINCGFGIKRLDFPCEHCLFMNSDSPIGPKQTATISRSNLNESVMGLFGQPTPPPPPPPFPSSSSSTSFMKQSTNGIPLSNPSAFQPISSAFNHSNTSSAFSSPFPPSSSKGSPIGPATPQSTQMQQIHLFIDQVNVTNTARYMLDNRTNFIIGDPSLVVRYDVLDKILAAGRRINQRVHFYTLDPSCTAQIESTIDGVDRAALASPAFATHLKTLILVTATDPYSKDYQHAIFYEVILKAIYQGWKVDLWTWKQYCHEKYVQLYQAYATGRQQGLTIYYLDEYRDLILSSSSK